MNTKILKALHFALYKHGSQKDDTGAPYVKHLLQVYRILSVVTKDEDILAAGLLHDTIEDTDTTWVDLVEEFGSRVSDLVWEVTKEKDGTFPRLKSRDAILIKFADRTSNLSRMETWSEKKKAWYIKSSKFWKGGDES